MASSLTVENASQWIEFASRHTSREIDQEVARQNPKRAARDKAKPLSEDMVQLTLTVTQRTFEQLKRAQSLRAQRQETTAYGEILAELLEFYLARKDPVKKAQRAKARAKSAQAKVELCPNRVKPSGRWPLTADERHAVFARDGGCCTHIDNKGQRCGRERWVEVHHLVPVHLGGTNDPENLTTLCSFHHDLAHQLSLPLEGQVTWLRAQGLLYSADP